MFSLTLFNLKMSVILTFPVKELNSAIDPFCQINSVSLSCKDLQLFCCTYITEQQCSYMGWCYITGNSGQSHFVIEIECMLSDHSHAPPTVHNPCFKNKPGKSNQNKGTLLMRARTDWHRRIRSDWLHFVLSTLPPPLIFPNHLMWRDKTHRC